jgi:hypothetical protein
MRKIIAAVALAAFAVLPITACNVHNCPGTRASCVNFNR